MGFREDILGVIDSVVTTLDGENLLLANRYDFHLVTKPDVTIDPITGAKTGGSDPIRTRVPMLKLKIKDQFKYTEGAPIPRGDALVKISQSTAKADILAADWMEIGGEKYLLADRDLEQDDNGLYWFLYLAKQEAPA